MTVIGVLASAVLAASAYTPPAGIAALAPYEGRWRLSLESPTSPDAKAGSKTTVIENHCLRFADHLACGQTVDGKDQALVVFSFDPATGAYASLFVDSAGTPHVGQLKREGDRFVFPWNETRDGKVVQFRVVNVFASPTRIDYLKESSGDGKAWSTIERGVETKEPPAQPSTSR